MKPATELLIQRYYGRLRIVAAIGAALALAFSLFFFAITFKDLFGEVPSYACSYLSRDGEPDVQELARCEGSYRKRKFQRAMLFQVLPLASFLVAAAWYQRIRNPHKTAVGRLIAERADEVVSIRAIGVPVRTNGVRVGTSYSVKLTDQGGKRYEIGVQRAEVTAALQSLHEELPEAEIDWDETRLDSV